MSTVDFGQFRGLYTPENFVGRGDVVERVMGDLKALQRASHVPQRCLTTVGEPGSGKTWLVRHIGETARWEFGDGFRVVSLNFRDYADTPSVAAPLIDVCRQLKDEDVNGATLPDFTREMVGRLKGVTREGREAPWKSPELRNSSQKLRTIHPFTKEELSQVFPNSRHGTDKVMNVSLGNPAVSALLEDSDSFQVGVERSLDYFLQRLSASQRSMFKGHLRVLAVLRFYAFETGVLVN